MNKVKKETTPSKYIKGESLGQIDFYDTFSTTNRENNLKDITHLVFNNPPIWIKCLFNLRNKIVRKFGLKTEMPADYNERFAIGGYIVFLKYILFLIMK